MRDTIDSQDRKIKQMHRCLEWISFNTTEQKIWERVGRVIKSGRAHSPDERLRLGERTMRLKAYRQSSNAPPEGLKS